MTVDGLYGQNEPKNATSFTGGYLEGKGSKWDDMGEIFYFPGLILPADEYTVSGWYHSFYTIKDAKLDCFSQRIITKLTK